MRKLASLEDDASTRKAKPLESGDARRLILSCNRTDLRSQWDRALWVIPRSRGFRSATVVNIRIEHIRFEQRGIVIGLRNEKTSMSRELFFTGTPHTINHHTCMPCIVKEYVDFLRGLGVENGPPFRSIDRWGQMAEAALTTQSVTALLRPALAKAGGPIPPRVLQPLFPARRSQDRSKKRMEHSSNHATYASSIGTRTAAIYWELRRLA